MAVARFEGTDPVLRYWLANCTGFAVEGAERGVVEALLRDADPHVTTRLVVRTRRGRRTIVSAASIAAVVPAERVLVVEPERREPREPREWPRLRAARRRAAATAGTEARKLAAAGPPARAAVAAAGRRLVRVAAPAAVVVAHSLGALAGELSATARMGLRSVRERWTIVRSWR
jgi:hypothetical protein